MPSSDPIDVLLASNIWATHNIIDACEKLSSEQFHQTFEMGLGSLHDTITHILGAMRGWSDFLGGRQQRPRLEGENRSPQQLRVLLDDIGNDLNELATAHATNESVTGSRGGKSYTFTRGAVLVHVTTHGMHHRAQCLNMLRHLGVDPLPASSVIEWTMMADPN